MNRAIKTFLMIFFAVGTAAAGSFSISTTPPSTLTQVTAAPPTYSYLSANLPITAAARRPDESGYIGTTQSNDFTTFDIPTNLPETVVPEPATLILCATGLIAATLRRRRLAA